MRTLLLIHHSHTDIGYTAPQARVTRWHRDFIRQALALAETPGEPPFKWVCECFWGVERFWEDAAADERKRFAEALRAGNIGLSANYLNFSELIDAGTLRRITARATAFGAEQGRPVRSAMSADINGYGWGFADILLDLGVENLFSCVHTHHGRYPLDRPQRPFWWQAHSGRRLLVWSGEHYHFGNELGVAPAAVASYTTKDDCDAAMIYGDHWAVAERRIPRYFAQLDEHGHPWDFAPVMVSGLRTDNGPPSAGIREFCQRWNREHGVTIRVEMATLDDFFQRLRDAGEEIPVHRGDWPDWWSDGPSGDATAVRLFRDAQRRAAALRAHGGEDAALDEHLALFAEHTFGHADAMTRPWRLESQAIRGRKLAYAAEARDLAIDIEGRLLAELGARGPEPGLPLHYHVFNPHAEPWRGPLRLPVHHYEFNERGLHGGLQLIKRDSGVALPSRLESAAGGGEVAAWLDLSPGQRVELEITPTNPEAPAEGDPVDPEAWEAAGQEGSLETAQFRLDWALPLGIIAMRDQVGGESLLRRGHPHAPFLPLRELTALGATDNIYGVRGAMGLNRKGPEAERGQGHVTRVWRSAREELYAALAFEIDCPGLDHCRLELRAWHAAPRLDASIRFHKASHWEPENVYLSLPFGAGELRLLKADAVLRPRIEQIPGTLTDFYALQEGFVITGASSGLALAMLDQHLLQVGPLEHGERLLAGEPRLADDPEHLYAWLMSNYWETNFAPDLGGFHEFRYRLTWGAGLAVPDAAVAACRNLAREVFCFRTGEASV